MRQQPVHDGLVPDFLRSGEQLGLIAQQAIGEGDCIGGIATP
jgi:hypothetical protein